MNRTLQSDGSKEPVRTQQSIKSISKSKTKSKARARARARVRARARARRERGLTDARFGPGSTLSVFARLPGHSRLSEYTRIGLSSDSTLRPVLNGCVPGALVSF